MQKAVSISEYNQNKPDAWELPAGHYYFDKASVHNYIVKEYGLSDFHIYETSFGNEFWFRGQCFIGCEKTEQEVELKEQKVFDYHGLPVCITFYKPKYPALK